jgi:tetratricopeptide (TPR) repeat protein
MGDLSAQRPSPAASGTLAKTPLLHLLLYAFEKKLAGTIDVVSPDKRVASVLFVGGAPAKAHVSEPVSYLGQGLVELGYLTVEVLDRTLAELEDARGADARPLYGEFLQQKGLLDAPCVEDGFREQMTRRLLHVAAMPPETTYAYYDGFDALGGIGADCPQGIDPLPILWPLLRVSAPGAHVDAALARVAGSSLRIAKTAHPVRLGLGAHERAAIERLRVRPLTVAEFLGVSGLAEHDARLLAYLMLVTKQVDVISASRPPPRTSSTPKMPVRAPTLPPPRTPSPPSPRSVVPQSLFPPSDAARSRPPPGLSQEISGRWAEIVDRARTIDRCDYFVMLDLARDSTPEETKASFLALAMKWHPDRLPPELFPLRGPCSRVFARLSEAHATLTDADKRERYMRLLVDGSGSPEMQETIAKVVEATSDFKKAELYFKQNDFVRAEELCRRALAGDATQPDYHAMLAWLISLKPENQAPEKAVVSIRMLDKALSMSGQCELAFYWRGMLYKRLGKVEAAYRDFHEAVELNPNNIDAVREMRLHNMRAGSRSRSTHPAATTRSSTELRKPTKQEEKSGLFGRFFKKS